MVEKNQSIPLEITGLTHEGLGVGRYEGMVIFVPATAPGDKVQVKIVKVQKHHCFGRLETLLVESPVREENQCPYFPQCGGCTLRHITYAQECQEKENFVTQNLSRIGGIEVELDPFLSSPQVERYRNKGQYPVQMIEGKAKIGFFAKRSHRLIPLEDCLLQPVVFSKIAKIVEEHLEEYEIPAYDEVTHTGLVRHLCMRTAGGGQEVMVTLVINGRKFPQWKELLWKIKEICPPLKTLLLNHHTKKRNVIMGDTETILYGDGKIRDTLAGVTLELSSRSFYQVNHGATELLYAKAKEYAQPQKEDLLLDLYCGIGSIGLSMAKEVKELIGVEIVPSAVENAMENAEQNGASNARFLLSDAGSAAEQLATEGLQPTIVMVDPPRKGIDQETVDAIGKMSPKRVVYVSCNSATLARDAKLLLEQGYQVKRGTAVDLFPRTTHVESVLLLEK